MTLPIIPERLKSAKGRSIFIDTVIIYREGIRGNDPYIPQNVCGNDGNSVDAQSYYKRAKHDVGAVWLV